MLIKKFIFLFFLTGSNGVFGQCIFSNFNISPSSCDQNGKLYFVINFTATGNSAKFTIGGNGNNYGTFFYSDLPVKLGPVLADCISEYEFLIKDSINVSCQVYKKIGKYCCDDFCKVRISKAKTGECKNGKYDLDLDLKYFASSEGFKIFNNGNFVNSYPYINLPIKVKELVSNSNETFNNISVCALNNEVCCDTVSIVNPCICSISNVRGQIQDCSILNKKFNVKLKFDYNNVSDSFRIGGNSFNYGTFAYKDLPVTLKNLSLSENIEYEFLIIDKTNPFCFNSYQPGIVNQCLNNCKLEIKDIYQIFCDSKVATLNLALKDQFSGLNGFELYRNNEKIGNYGYGQTNYLVDFRRAGCDSVFNYRVQDSDNELCKADTFLTLNACCNRICHLSNMKIIENCQNGKLSELFINFDFSGVSDSFDLSVSNNYYGKYSYTSLPLKIPDSILSLPNLSFVITDIKSDTCKLQLLYNVTCFAPPKCNMKDVEMKYLGCDENGNYFANLKFKVKDPVANGFIIKVNGKFYDSLEYGNASYMIGPLLPDCITNPIFFIQDKSDVHCNTFYSLPEIICCKKKCLIQDFTIVENCVGNKGSSLSLDFKYEGVSDTFTVRLNNIFYGKFNYKDLPLKLSDSMYTVLEVLVSIFDNVDDTCRIEKLYTLKCFLPPKCNVSNFEIEPMKCDDKGVYFADLSFQVTNPVGLGFIIKYNGYVYDTFDYKTGVYKVGPFAGNCTTKDHFKVTDLKDSLCAAEYRLPESICCKICQLSESGIKLLPCVNGKFDLVIDFKKEYINDKFILKINNISFGYYKYTDLPFTLHELDFKGEVNIVIYDSLVTDCKLTLVLPGKDCISDIDNDGFESKLKLFNITDKLYFESSYEDIRGTIAVYDISGKLILETEFWSNVEIDIKEWPKGIYLVFIKNGAKITRKKWVKF